MEIKIIIDQYFKKKKYFETWTVEEQSNPVEYIKNQIRNSLKNIRIGRDLKKARVKWLKRCDSNDKDKRN